MRAISLWQPWASAIAIGAKPDETRGWYTAYRGPLAIHAAQTKDCASFIFHPSVRGAFRDAGIKAVKDLPFGSVLLTCRLAGCVPTEQRRSQLGALALAFGDYTSGRFAWLLEDVVVLPEPVPARGAQGFWKWNEERESDLFG